VLKRLPPSLIALLAALPGPGTAAPGPAPSFESVPRLSVSGREILADGKPVRGMFVYWHIPEDAASQEEEIRAELARIRELGFTGISIEAGWKDCIPLEGQSRLGSTAADSVLRWAAEEGLWAQLLLAPHCVPQWVFEKHGDIRMRPRDGQPADGHFLPFSPHSPAVQDLIAFQQAAVRHFSAYPNVLCFWLTNETGYGRSWLDCSEWGLTAWRKWLHAVNPDVGFWNRRWGTAYGALSEVEAPGENDGQRRVDWARFNRLSLIDFFNRLYREAARSRTRFVPVGHRLSLYSSLDAFASPFGVHPSPRLLKMDVLGCDHYGVEAGVLALQQAFGVPVIVAGTNLPRTAETMVAGARTLRMLLRLQFSGAAVQTMYAWNTFQPDSVPRGMRYEDGKLLAGTRAAVEMARLMRDWPVPAALPAPQAAVVLPASALSVSSSDFERYQRFAGAVSDIVHQAGSDCSVLLSDDLCPGAYLEPPTGQLQTPPPPGEPSPEVRVLSACRVLFVADDRGLDQGFLECEVLKRWVERGGVLVLAFREQGPPLWTGIRHARSAGRQSVRTTPASGRWAFQSREFGAVSTLELAPAEGQPPAVTVLAALEKTEEPVALRVRVGEGFVVYAGVELTGSGLGALDAGYLWDALELAGLSFRATPSGPRVHTAGGFLFVWTGSDWTGKITAPAEVAGLRVYDRDGRPLENPALQAAGAVLTGTLYEGQFAVADFRPRTGGD
jgi:hypothetical protein